MSQIDQFSLGPIGVGDVKGGVGTQVRNEVGGTEGARVVLKRKEVLEGAGFQLEVQGSVR